MTQVQPPATCAMRSISTGKKNGSWAKVVHACKVEGMDFPIIDLLDEEISVTWLMKHFHPDGLRCPHCQAEHSEARYFRANVGSGLPVYRCQQCDGIYHLYSGTLFEGSQLTPGPGGFAAARVFTRAIERPIVA